MEYLFVLHCIYIIFIMIQRILNILGSISLLAVIYLINKGIGVGYLLKYMDIHLNYNLPHWVSYVFYIVVVLVYTGLLILLFKHLRPGELRNKNIEHLDADNSGFLAMILAYVFVGLSINNAWTLMAIILFLLIFNLCGSSYIYNPLFYIFGYRYYYITSSKTKILLMTKTRYPLGAIVDFKQCGCLNDYTYIDISKNKN